MRSVSKEVRKKRITVVLPETVYDKAVQAARSGGQSLSSWLRYAISAYVRKWQVPADDVDSVGLFCSHPACHCSVNECKKPKAHQKQNCWIETPV